MVRQNRVQRNPGVVWRRETKGGVANGVLLFNYGSRNVHFLEGLGKQIWEKCNGTDIETLLKDCGAEESKEQVTGFLKGLVDRGLVSIENGARSAQPPEIAQKTSNTGEGMWSEKLYFDAPLFVQFDCTNHCNLRCRHCVTMGGELIEGELSTVEALAIIKELSKIGVFQVGFSGGEPLMREDIFTLMSAVKEHGMKVQLTTNATLVDGEVAERISKLDPVTVGVSLEGGSKESYEYFRGKGNFEHFLQGVRVMKEHGLPVKFKSAVSKKNLGEIDLIIELALELGVDAVDMFLFYPQGRGESMKDETLVPEEIREFLSVLSRKRRELEGKLAIDVDDKPNAFLVDPSLSHSTCGAGLYWAEILPNGDVVPCVFFREVVAGNIKDADFKKAWDSGIWEPFRDRRGVKGKCSTCIHLTRCGGGCRANGYALTGDFLAEDRMCWYDGEAEHA